MRVIKFRGWNKDKKQILPVCDISFGDDGRALTTVFQTSPKGKYYHGLVDGENGVLMQFTGLLDKNGKEIYEGDICHIESGFLTSVFEVYWDDDAWHLKNGTEDYNNGDYYHGYQIDWNEAEIIGNIYENPELLT